MNSGARRRRSTHVTRVEVESDRGVFMISVAAELARMHPQTLRMYEARGLIEPKRSPKGTRLYSQEDVDKLRRIQEMTADLGLNLAGVERVLDLEREIERCMTRIEDLEVKALHAQVRLAEELEQLRRSYPRRARRPLPRRRRSSCARPTPVPPSASRRRARHTTEQELRWPLATDPARPGPRRSRARSSASGAT